MWGKVKKNQGRVPGVVLSNQEDDSGCSGARRTGWSILERLEEHWGQITMGCAHRLRDTDKAP